MLIEEVSKVSTQALFHGSKKQIPVGTILVPKNSKKYPEEVAVEAILEFYRPKHMLSRRNSVYMVDKPDENLIDQIGGYSSHIYQVLPIGTVEKNDVSWWAFILNNGAIDFLQGDISARDDLKKAAKAYWHGKPGPNPKWEYRSTQARIIKRIK